MTDEQAIVYLESLKEYVDKIAYAPDMYGAIDKAIQVLEQQPCEDCVSRNDVVKAISDWIIEGEYDYTNATNYLVRRINYLPSVKPKYTDEEIQKMQELEQVQLEKAYELGKTESFEEWLSSFNTESATACFTAVQELKKRLEGDIT